MGTYLDPVLLSDQVVKCSGATDVMCLNVQ